MRFKKRMPEYGDTEVRTKFLLFPMTIYKIVNGSDLFKETRWLERVKIEYEYMYAEYGYWFPKRFLD